MYKENSNVKPIYSFQVLCFCQIRATGYLIHYPGVCHVSNKNKFCGTESGKNSGRYCWRVTGTLCSVKVQVTFAEKAKNCSKCEFYLNVKERKEVIPYEISVHSLKPFKFLLRKNIKNSKFNFMLRKKIPKLRPGLQASKEEWLIHPFLSLGIQKEEIRQMAQDCGFDFWNKPSASCLASRIPYGEEITVEKLQMVENAENILHDLGFSNLRVRLHGKIALIELIPEEFEKAVNLRHRIVELLKDCGFSYIILDLKGYRSGSMDEVL